MTGDIRWNDPYTPEEQEEYEERVAIMLESDVKHAYMLARQIIILKRVGSIC